MFPDVRRGESVVGPDGNYNVWVAADPQAGDVISGTGGARKVRVAGKGKGKSGGYRVITFFAAEDVPVFLLRLVSKGQRADISQAERNDVRAALATLAENYREESRRKVRALSVR